MFFPDQVLFSRLPSGPQGAALPLCAWARASPRLCKAARGRSSWIHQQPCRRANRASVWSGGHSQPHPPSSSWLAPGGDRAYAPLHTSYPVILLPQFTLPIVASTGPQIGILPLFFIILCPQKCSEKLSICTALNLCQRACSVPAREGESSELASG